MGFLSGMSGRLFVLGSLSTIALVVFLLFQPLLALVLLVLCILVVGGLSIPRSLRAGMGVLGAIAASVLFPPLFTPLPAATGVIVGIGWLIFMSASAGKRPSGVLRFWVVAAVLALGTVMSLQFLPDAYRIWIVVFLILIGFASGRLHASEQRLVRLGIVCVAVLEGAWCAFEFLVLRHPVLGSETSGFHPVFPDFIRSQGTLGHPIVAGVVLLVGLTLLLSSDLGRRTKTLGLLVLLLGIFTTGSSSVFIVAAVCLVLPFALLGGWIARGFKLIALAGSVVLVTVQQQSLTPVAADVTGINTVHRVNSIKGIPALIFERPFMQSLLGTGWDSERYNYRAGYLVDDGLYSLDNMFGTVLMATGVIGLGLLLIFLIWTYRRKAQAVSLAIFGLVFMFFAFDVLSWASSGALFIFVACAAALQENKRTNDSSASSSISKDAELLPSLRA